MSVMHYTRGREMLPEVGSGKWALVSGDVREVVMDTAVTFEAWMVVGVCGDGDRVIVEMPDFWGEAFALRVAGGLERVLEWKMMAYFSRFLSETVPAEVKWKEDEATDDLLMLLLRV